MKDFGYYRANDNPHPYPNKDAYIVALRQAINNERLTAAERDQKLALVKQQATIWFKEAIKPHYEFNAARKEEFWRDCRAEIGYDQFLDSVGCKLLENKASEDNFETAYHNLVDLASFIQDILPHAQTQSGK